MCVMKMRKPLLAVLFTAIVLLVVGFVFGNRMNDFLSAVLATSAGILFAVLLAWVLFEKRGSVLLNRIYKILERNEQYEQSVQKSWDEKNLLPIAVILLEVTHQVVHDLQEIEDSVCIGRENISDEAEKVLKEMDNFFRPRKDSFIKINSAAANSLTQSSKLLDRLEAYLTAGPDWIKDDPRIAELIQESMTCMDNMPVNVFIYSNVHPMARRVKLVAGSFEIKVSEVWCTTIWHYLEQLTNLTMALDKRVHR